MRWVVQFFNGMFGYDCLQVIAVIFMVMLLAEIAIAICILEIKLDPLEIPLHHGTLLLMHGTTNTYWEHHIPKSAKAMLPRINLTFRQVR